MTTISACSLKHPKTRFARLLASAALAVVMGATAPSATAQTSSLIQTGQDGWLFAGWGNLTEFDQSAIDANAKLITQARDALATKNITLLLLMVPDKALLYSDKLPAGTSPSKAVQGRYQTILKQLRDAGVVALDDQAILLGVQKQGKSAFYRTDQHWTQDAVDATALATAELIRQTVGQLAGQAGTGKALGETVKERRHGDLAQLFMTAEQRKELGRETYTVRRQPDEQSLLDDTAAPVHVSGNSMVQPYFGFPQMLSNTLDRPVTLNWKPGNVGHWQILLDYLESPAFAQQKPQVLVWELLEPTYAHGPEAKGWWDNASIMNANSWLSRLNAAIAR